MPNNNFNCAILALCTLLAACSGGSPPEQEARAYVASADCPLRTPHDWQQLLDRAAAEPRWTTTCSDLDNCEEISGDFERDVPQHVLDVFSRCQADVDDNPPIAACIQRLRSFVPAWLRQHSSSTYGFDQPNRDYFARQGEPDKPEHLMDPPPALLAALPQRSRLEAVARAQGWPYLLHDSGLGGVRLFVLVSSPDGRFDQWVVFGFDAKLERVPDDAIVSFIGLQKTDRSGVALPRAQPHFRDYVAHQQDSGWHLELPSTFEGKCYACHVNGLRQLLPTRGQHLESQPVLGEARYGTPVDTGEYGASRLLSFNSLIAGYGIADWGDSLAPKDHGPALGQALGCPDCHNGSVRGALSVFTSEGMLWEKVVGQLAMRHHDAQSAVPDTRTMQLLEQEAGVGPALSSAEVAELGAARDAHTRDFEALMASRTPDLAQWLLQTPCE